MTPATKHRIIVNLIAAGLLVADAVVATIVHILSGPDLALPATIVAVVVSAGAAVESTLKTLETQNPIQPLAATAVSGELLSVQQQPPVVVNVHNGPPPPPELVKP